MTVSGTKGFYCQTTNAVILDDDKFNHETDEYRKGFDSENDFIADYQVEDWKNITSEEIERGHGGMDYIMLRRFFRAVRDGKPMPIDVYDAVSWMCVTALSEQSIALGSRPVEFPDFTRGQYKRAKPRTFSNIRSSKKPDLWKSNRFTKKRANTCAPRGIKQ